MQYPAFLKIKQQQKLRLWLRSAFFLLFIFAPILDIFRLDLNLGHFIFFGHNWTLGLTAFQTGEIDETHAVINIILYGFLPLLLIFVIFFMVSWYYGRLYCGWLCPHFSVVEMINRLMQKTIGKASLWDREYMPVYDFYGKKNHYNKRNWLITLPIILSFAFLWAFSLLSYLLPPREIIHNLFTGNLTTFQFYFLTVGTLVFFIEFTFARHLFCRFACAVGLFQSLVWMANKTALVIRFQRERVTECVDCPSYCNDACPMRLKPRATKRVMFTCTQCGQCILACNARESQRQQPGLLHWVQNEDALDVSDRDFKQGKHFIINKK